MQLMVDILKGTGNGGRGNMLISNIYKNNYLGEFKKKVSISKVWASLLAQIVKNPSAMQEMLRHC